MTLLQQQHQQPAELAKRDALREASNWSIIGMIMADVMVINRLAWPIGMEVFGMEWPSPKDHPTNSAHHRRVGCKATPI